MTDLLALADRVEKADGPDRELDCLIAVEAMGFFAVPPKYEDGPVGYGYIKDGEELHPGHGGDQLVPRYTSSLDAAMTLVPEGALWLAGYAVDGLPMASVDFGNPVRASTPALALVSACLRARAALGGGS